MLRLRSVRARVTVAAVTVAAVALGIAAGALALVVPRALEGRVEARVDQAVQWQAADARRGVFPAELSTPPRIDLLQIVGPDGRVLRNSAEATTWGRFSRFAAEQPDHLFSTYSDLFVGVAMYAGTTFLSQYFQLAKGHTPIVSGLMTLPMVIGLALSSLVAGQLITRYGRWKRFIVLGLALLTLGVGLMGTLRADTSYVPTAFYMLIVGIGLGMAMQNLVLAVQNTIPADELGAGSSLVSFFRTMGGAIGISALGALLAGRVTHYLAGEVPAGAASGIPDLKHLPPAVRTVVENAYGHGLGDVFLVAAPFALVAFLVVMFIKENPLRTSSGIEREADLGPVGAGRQ